MDEVKSELQDSPDRSSASISWQDTSLDSTLPKLEDVETEQMVKRGETNVLPSRVAPSLLRVAPIGRVSVQEDDDYDDDDVHGEDIEDLNNDDMSRG